MEDESLRKNMGEKARLFVRENYNMVNNIDSWVKTYQQVLSKWKILLDPFVYFLV